MLNILILIVAVWCMVLAQSTKLKQMDRRLYSLIGSGASIMVAIKAAGQGQMGTASIFAVAAFISLTATAIDFIRSSR